MLRSFFCICLVSLSLSAATAPTSALVSVAGVPILTVHGRVGSFSPDDRARLIEQRITALSEDRFFSPDSLGVAESEFGFDVLAGGSVLVTITAADAKAAGMSREDLAHSTLKNTRQALEALRLMYTPKDILTRAAYGLGATLLLLFLLWAIRFCFGRLYLWIHGGLKAKVRPVVFAGVEWMSTENVVDFLAWLARMARMAAVVAVFYIYIPLALSFFPHTANLAPKLLSHLIAPLVALGNAVLDGIPNLFSILVICFVTRFILKFIRLFFTRIEKGVVTLQGFYPEWAEPTYKLVRLFAIALSLVAIFPYFPGAHSPAFQAVSVFLGVLFSLGSSSAVANVVSGVVLTYMRPFKIGDRVKIADTVGDVTEKSLLVTRIRTVKNVDITVPNSLILGSHIVNYSSSAPQEGLILHTSVTIGYDAPWKQVHALLLEAASRTSDILPQPAPFVLQTSLNDFAVTYELNAYTHAPNAMAMTYSALHENIQTAFNAAGVEILSPNYVAVRDGSDSTVPPQG